MVFDVTIASSASHLFAYELYAVLGEVTA